jgi:phosphate transport system substrate-binding protein
MLLAALLVLLTPIFGIAPAGAETLVVPGTGSCETVLQSLAAAFNAQHPGHEVQVPPSIGSGAGIQAVLKDVAVLARVARPLEESEAKQGLGYVAFAKDPVVFVTAKNIGVHRLSSEQLVDVFSGRIDNWQQLGGKNAPIRVLIREPGDSSLRIIQEHVKAFKNIVFTDRGKIVYHVYEMVEMLSKYKNSIGWITRSSLFPVKESIEPLAIDNIAPTTENVLSGTYALVETEALVYKKGALTNLASDFIAFIFSSSGRKILSEYGLIPLAKE